MSSRLYMREHSDIIRRYKKSKEAYYEEDTIVELKGSHKIVFVTMCRIRQRLLKQTWNRLVLNTEVNHDYEIDARIVLCRRLTDDELRTELEIEVLYNWINQIKNLDPTSIATSIIMCKKRSLIYTALQQMRIEFLNPGETILYQGDIPKPEDGHFTIFRGSCDVIQFPEESVSLFKLQYLVKKRKWDDCKKLLNTATVLANISKCSGFGELSTLTGLSRAATIRVNQSTSAEVVIVPKLALTDLLKYRRFSQGIEGIAPSEAMDFMRQSGLAHRISPKDLVRAAHCMIRRTLLQGDILYYKGQHVKSIFLVVSGELLLDTGELDFDDETKQPQPFNNSFVEICYHLSSGSILGDEGVVGHSRTFVSTAVVVSEAAVVFEVVDFGLRFLSEKFGALRYCALAYKDVSRWSVPLQSAEELNPYTFFHSLRQSIAFLHPNRGSQDELFSDNNDLSTSNNNNNHTSSANIKYKSSTYSSSSAANANISEPSTVKSHSLFDTYSKRLKSVYLHRAIEINKIAKKLIEKSIKFHAQDNILFEEMSREMLKKHQTIDANTDLLNTFKKHVNDYRDRSAKEFALQEIDLENKGNASSSASTFFSNLNISTFNDDDHNNNNYQDSNIMESENMIAASKEIQTSSIDDFADLEMKIYPSNKLNNINTTSKLIIEQYFYWLDILNRHTFRNFMKQLRTTKDSQQQYTEEVEIEMYNLCVLFNKLGLTPVDISTSSHYINSMNSKNSDGTISNSNNNINDIITPSSVVPLLTLPVVVVNPHIHSYTRDKVDIVKMSSTSNAFPVIKTFSPTSWKKDIKTKKKIEFILNVETFQRSSIPNSRRVSYESYTYPGQFHPYFTPSDLMMADFDHNVRRSRMNSVIFSRQITQTQQLLTNHSAIDIDVTCLTDPEKYLKVIEKLDFSNRKLSSPIKTRYLVVNSSNNKINDELKISSSSTLSNIKSLKSYSKQSMLNKAENIKQSNKTLLYNNENVLFSDKQITETRHFPHSFFQTETLNNIPTYVITMKEDNTDFQSRKVSIVSNISNPIENEENSVIRNNLETLSYEMPDDKSITSKNSTLGLDSSNPLFLSSSQISAPAPSHIEESTFTCESGGVNEKIKSVLEDDVITTTVIEEGGSSSAVIVFSVEVDQPQLCLDTHTHSHLVNQDLTSVNTPLQSAPSIMSAQTETHGSPPSTAKRKVHKHKSLAQQKLDEMKARLLDKDASAALETFQSFLTNDNNPRKFYEGKKRALCKTSYALPNGTLNTLHNEEVFHHSTEKEIKLFGKEKSSISAELTLFNSIYSNNTTQQHRTKLIEHLRNNSSTNKKQQNELDKLTLGLQGFTNPHPRSNSTDLIPAAKNENDSDIDDIQFWQDFTLNVMIKEKTGPKKTLPVLIVKCEGGSSSKRFLVNKSKRWGSGALVPLDAEQNEKHIVGPPSFLEVLNHKTKSKLPEKDRKRILEEIKSKYY